MVTAARDRFGPGRFAPARLILAALALALPAQAAFGQARPAAPAQAQAPTPDQLTSLKLLWSIMAAVDHANRTGNYSVLRDLGTPAFQARNNPANLAAIFAGLREQNVDLSNTLIVTPAWEIAPAMVQARVLRMRGSFPLRPAAILFDLLFAWDGGGWRLEGIAIQAQPPDAPMSPAWTLILVGLAGIIGWVLIQDQLIRRKIRAAKSWAVTTGTVVHSSVSWTTRTRARGRTTRYHFPVVRYSYSVGGQDYMGDRLSFDSVETMIEATAEEMRRPFPEGTIVEVRYNPQNPHECILAATLR